MKHAPRKRFGQHFLTDHSVIAAIVSAIAPRAGERLVEIGPGLGALTVGLLERTARLEAIRSPFRTAEAFGVEEIIDPRQTRTFLCEFSQLAYRLIKPQPSRVQYRP